MQLGSASAQIPVVSGAESRARAIVSQLTLDEGGPVAQRRARRRRLKIPRLQLVDRVPARRLRPRRDDELPAARWAWPRASMTKLMLDVASSISTEVSAVYALERDQAHLQQDWRG